MSLTTEIKNKAIEIGFSKIGISKALYYEEDRINLNNWIDNGYNASMQWIENRKEERSNILKYYPKAQSVISIAINYYTGNSSDYFDNYKISNYAWGDDYHIMIKKKLYKLLNHIKSLDSSIDGICCVDTSPVSEKVWAQRSGIGWIGKHTTLITKEYGSWVFLGEIILNTKLDYDKPFTQNLCGSCTACIDSCPTSAISDYTLDSKKCISYLTIEHRGTIPQEYADKMEDWVYGCDICQEVCPWTKRSKHTSEESFKPRDLIVQTNLEEIDRENYTKIFKNSPIKRTKLEGLKRNLNLRMKSKK